MGEKLAIMFIGPITYPNPITVLAGLRKKHKRPARKMPPRRLKGSPRLLHFFFVESVKLFVIR